MSLLMQALKKAERAKQNSIPEDGLDKPSEAYDQILSLSPAEAAPAPAPRPADTLSLAPLAEAAPRAPLDFAEAVAAPVAPPLHDFAPRQEPPPAAPSRSEARPDAHGAARPQTRQESAAPRPRAATRARPAPPPRSIDPATLRLGVLGGIAVLIVAGFAYWFWHETSGAGASANLPMVPMPLTDAPGATPAPTPLLVAPEEPAVADAAPEQPRAQEASQHVQAIQAAAAPAPQAAPQAAPPPPPAGAEGGEIRVLRGDSAPRLNTALESAYQAFTSGDSEAARRQYDAVLRQEANNRDALLGLAAIAVRERQGAQAAGHYLRLLELDPNDGEALAGLIALRQGDAVQGESRLKAILQRSPDAGPVLFALGNLYAKQSRWSEAQQLFFRAYSATPGNPDYAFNLAVGLDRLNQGKLALGYYQRALALAQNTPGAFDRGAVRRRMHELSQADAAPPAPTN